MRSVTFMTADRRFDFGGYHSEFRDEVLFASQDAVDVGVYTPKRRSSPPIFTACHGRARISAKRRRGFQGAQTHHVRGQTSGSRTS